MNVLKIFRNKYFIIFLSIITFGLFSVAWMIYISIKLKTLRALGYRPATATGIAFGVSMFLVQAWGAFILLIFVTHWFIIPKYLNEERWLVGLEVNVSWKIGLLPMFASFYTFGFIFIHAPTRELSDSTTIVVGIPMIISAIFAIFIWIMVVHEKFIEYIDKKQTFLAERIENSQVRRRGGRHLSEKLEPYHRYDSDDLPLLELPKEDNNMQLSQD